MTEQNMNQTLQESTAEASEANTAASKEAKQKKTPYSMRLKDETKALMNELVKELGGDAEYAMSQLLDIYQINVLKAENPKQSADIEKMEEYLQLIKQMFLSGVQERATIRERAENRFRVILQDQETQNDGYRKIIAELTTEKNNHIAELKQAKKQLAETKAAADEAEKLNKTLSAAVAQAQKKENRYQEQETKIEKLSAELAELKQQNQSQKEELKQQQEKLQKQQQEIEAERKNAEAEKNRSLQEQKQRSELEKVKTEAENNKKLQELENRYTAQLQKAETENAKKLLEAERKRFETVQNLQARLLEVQNEHAAELKELQRQQKAETERLQKQVEELAAVNKDLQKQVHDLNTEITEMLN